MYSFSKFELLNLAAPRRFRKSASLGVAISVAALLVTGCAGNRAVSATNVTETAAPVSTFATREDAAQARRDLMKLLGGDSTEFPTPDAAQLKLFREAQSEAAQWAQIVLRSEMKPVASGAGVLICEPVEKPAASPEDSALFAGCARWMQVALGGQSALGKSPLWRRIEEARNGLGFSNLKLGEKQAAMMARAVGATHTVAMRAASTPDGYRLSLQLLTAAGQPVGKPLVVAGTETTVLAELPDAAREIGRRLQAPSVQIPAVGVGADDLRFLGAHAQFNEKIDKDEALRLQELAAREPLAGVLWMYRSGTHVDRATLWRDVIKKSVTAAPRNTLVWCAVAALAPTHLKPHRAEFQKLVRENPRNMALALAEAYACKATNDFNTQLEATVRAVAANERSSAAWVALSMAFADKADSIRNGRFYNRMSEEEKAAIAQYYPHQLMAALYAAQISPSAVSAWSQLSRAATFNSEPELADLALWKTLRMSPESINDWEWALQIYQPKWFEDEERLLLVARHIASKPERLTYVSKQLSAALETFEMTEASAAVTRAVMTELESQVKANPKNIEAWRILAYRYRDQKRYADTVRAFETWLELEPENIIPVNNLANWHAKNQRDIDKMHKLYERGVKMDPQNAVMVYNWGGYYKDYERDFDKAAPLMKKAMELDKSYTLPVTALGNLYWFLKNDEKNGRKYFEAALQRNPLDGYVQAEYAYALMRHGKTDEARKHAERALQLGESEHPVFQALGIEP